MSEPLKISEFNPTYKERQRIPVGRKAYADGL